MKKVLWFVITLALVVLGLYLTLPRGMSGGERFVGRQGGTIKVSIVEGDPRDPIDIRAASKGFFRIQNEEEVQFVSDLEPEPLGYLKDDYYYLRESSHGETRFKILNAKARIQFEISEVVEEGQQISITYQESGWYKFGIWLLLSCLSVASAVILDLEE